MQNLFIQENEEFTIKFTVATDDKGTIYCDLNRESMEETLKDVEGADKMEIQDYNAVFKKPSFGETTKLYEEIFLVNSDGASFNPILMRQKFITSLIKSWNLKGIDEKPTEKDIKALHPIIATAIAIQLDAEVGSLVG
jgi:hypothetical protein